MTFGSRLGAAGIVLLVGIFDSFQRRPLTVRRASKLGLITFLVTYSIGIPATVAGYVWVRTTPLGWVPKGTGEGIRHLGMPHVIEWVVGEIVVRSGPFAAFFVTVVLLVGSLRLVGGVLEEMDFDALRHRYRHDVHSRWIAFSVGLAVKGLTTRIAF